MKLARLTYAPDATALPLDRRQTWRAAHLDRRSDALQRFPPILGIHRQGTSYMNPLDEGAWQT